MKILTEYRIIKSQCPLWEEHTRNIRYFPSWVTRPSQSLFVPPPLKGFIQYIDTTPFIIAVKLFNQKGNYDIVITGDLWVGIFYALLRKLFAKDSCPHLFLDLMLDAEKRENLLWRCKRWVQKEILASVDCMLVFSQNELEYYSKVLNISQERFRFVSYHTNITQPRMVSANTGYLFSAGRSGRDYKTLIEAVKDVAVELIIVSDQASMQGIDVPPHVKVYYDLLYDNYIELLKNSKIVIIPVVPHIRSLGMVVMLEAMALGKPIISTRGISSVEYIRDGENGYLVEAGDSQAIRKKTLYLLHNPKKCVQLGKNALRDVKEHWSFEKYVQSVLSIAQELVNGYKTKPR